MTAILQMTFSNLFSCLKTVGFWFKFQWSLIIRVQFFGSSYGLAPYGTEPLPMMTKFIGAYMRHLTHWDWYKQTLIPCAFYSRLSLLKFVPHSPIDNIGTSNDDDLVTANNELIMTHLHTIWRHQTSMSWINVAWWHRFGSILFRIFHVMACCLTA